MIECVLELFLQGLKKGKKGGQCCDKMCSRAVPAWIKKKAKEKMSELKKAKKKKCLSPGSNWGPLVCETNVITNYTTQTCCLSGGLV